MRRRFDPVCSLHRGVEVGRWRERGGSSNAQERNRIVVREEFGELLSAAFADVTIPDGGG
jgi:hypothetical protein